MAASTQDFLEFDEIREGTVILKDRSIRGILLVSSMNFALKAEDEQDAIIYQFQNFLNSLDFSLQILIHSRRLNITGYLERLETLAAQQTNQLLKKQTEEYQKFIGSMIKGGAIFSKTFFVSIPFNIMEVQRTVGKKGARFAKPKLAGKLSDEEFERMKTQLWQRMEFLALGLRRMGLHVSPLNTEEIIELLWSWYHPAQSEVGYYPEIPPELLKEHQKKTP